MGLVKTNGKLILSGEHGVVYGEPAVVAGVSLAMRIQMENSDKDRILIESSEFRVGKEYGKFELLENLRRARSVWDKFSKEGDFDGLKKMKQEDEFFVAAMAVAVGLERWGCGGGLKVRVGSEIPVGSGMGSSAAVTAGVLMALAEKREVIVSKEELSNLVYGVEQLVHGKPSGVDNTAVVYGGLIRFQRKEGKLEFEAMTPKQSLAEVLIIQSGIPVESTGEMVALVKKRTESRKQKTEKIIENMGRVTKKFIGQIKKGVWPVDLIKENQRLLEELGVVSERAREMVGIIEASGGVAKVCGAGGVKEGSGVLLAYHERLFDLVGLAKTQGWQYWKVRLGE